MDFDEKNPSEHKLLDDTFAVKAAGNKLGKVVGGRSVHAPFLTVGGFIKIPSHQDLFNCILDLEAIRPKVLDLIEIFTEEDETLIRKDLDFAALSDSEYSFLYGDLIRTDGSRVPADHYGDFLEHVTVPYSHASGYKFGGNVYMVGALARLNLAKDKLHNKTIKTAAKYLELFPSKNIFHNNLAQAIEILHAIDSAIEIIEKIEIKNEKPISPVRKEGIGIGVIEAPRGALYYKLEIDNSGKVRKGQIVVPTGQNQIGIEGSIRQYLTENLDRVDSKEEIEQYVERIVRAYDPCMSCASHFLKFKWV